MGEQEVADWVDAGHVTVVTDEEYLDVLFFIVSRGFVGGGFKAEC